MGAKWAGRLGLVPGGRRPLLPIAGHRQIDPVPIRAPFRAPPASASPRRKLRPHLASQHDEKAQRRLRIPHRLLRMTLAQVAGNE